MINNLINETYKFIKLNFLSQFNIREQINICLKNLYFCNIFFKLTLYQSQQFLILVLIYFIIIFIKFLYS